MGNLKEYLERVRVYNEVPVDIVSGKGQSETGRRAITFNISYGQSRKPIGQVSIESRNFQNGVLTNPDEFKKQLQALIDKNKNLFGGETTSSSEIVAGIGFNRIKVSEAVELEYQGGKLYVTPEGKVK